MRENRVVELKLPIKYYGGKQNMVRDILPLIPEHITYVEPFVGGGAVFWAKTPSEVEVINDINGDVVNFYRVLKTKPKMLTRMIVRTPRSRLEYARAMKVLRSRDGNAVRRAWAFWTTTQQGFAGAIETWGFSVKEKRYDFHNKKGFFEFDYKSYSERLSLTQIECDDALRVIERYDTLNTFFYLDPPYIGTDCKHYSGYVADDFKKLINLLKRIKGKFILSCGDVGAGVVREMQVDWIELCFVKQTCVVLNKDRVRPPRMEYVFMNFDHKNDFNLTLFDGVEDAKWI